jgi:hypothetical protein
VIAPLLESIGGGSPLAPALGLLAVVLLGLSPVALPAVPVAVSILSPGRVQEGRRSGASWWRSVPTVAAFVVGMDGVLRPAPRHWARGCCSQSPAVSAARRSQPPLLGSRLLSGGVSTLRPGERAAASCPDPIRPALRSAASRPRALVEQGLRQRLGQPMCLRRRHDAGSRVLGESRRRRSGAGEEVHLVAERGADRRGGIRGDDRDDRTWRSTSETPCGAAVSRTWVPVAWQEDSTRAVTPSSLGNIRVSRAHQVNRRCPSTSKRCGVGRSVRP